MTRFDGNNLISLLGLTSEANEVRAFLAASEISRKPKPKRGDVTDVLLNHDLGLEITFRDEANLDVRSRDYEEGALVLSNIRMYGKGHSVFKPFPGELPMGLSLDQKPEEARATLGEPTRQNPQGTFFRWDRPGFVVFLRTDSNRERITEVAVQLPMA